MKVKHVDVIKRLETAKGDQLIIRRLCWDDIEDARAFANDLSKEDTFVSLSGEEISWDQEVEYVARALEQVAKGERIHLVAKLNGQFAGMAGVTRLKRRRSHVGEVDISVGRRFRGRGIGRVLLETLIEESRRANYRLLVLTCFQANKRAIRLYRKAGFRKAGQIPAMLNYKNDYVPEVSMYLILAK